MNLLLQNKIKFFIGTLVLVLSFVVVPFFALAQFNKEINYQGKLTDSSGVAVADGLYNMNFWLLSSSTAATSTALWSETRVGADQVQVTNGLFSVMLGEVTSLDGLDFNQTLYLGVEIGGTGTPAWDGEMSPRKILGAVPAAFVAETANTFDGLATTSFLRANDIDTMEATSSSALLTLIQNGAGNLLSIFAGATEMFTILNNGNVGIATSTPDSKLTVVGNSYLGGNITITGNASIVGTLADSTNATGTSGQILSSTGVGTDWISTSALGLGDGTFAGLSDVSLSSLTANRLIFASSTGSSLTDSANLTFDGTNFGLGSQSQIAWGGVNYLYASSTNDSIAFGENAGATFNSGTTYNIALGYEAGRNASNSNADNNNYIGYQAGYNNAGISNNIIGFFSGYNNTGSNNNVFGSSSGSNNTGSYNNLFGNNAGSVNTGSNNNIFGLEAGQNNTGSNNNILSAHAGKNNTGSYNNLFGGFAGFKNTGSYNEIIGYETGYNLQATSSIIIGSQAFRGGAGSTAFQAVNNVALGYRAGYSAQTGSSNNILLGYQAADNLTTGANNIVIGYDVDIASTTGSNQLNIGNLIFGTGIDGTGTTLSSGNIGIGTSTPLARLAISKLNFASAGVAGLDQYFTFTNATPSTAQFATQLFIKASTTATTTIAGGFWKIEDNTTFGNTIRGFEVQTERGSNTLGENTAISGFARTFGLRGTTEGDAGGSFEPAGIFAETRGSEQGNAIRGYSSSITTTALLKLFQDTSTFAGTGLLMNFGNGGGSFSSTTSKFVDLQNAGSSMFTIGAYGMVTIGDGTTGQSAGLQIGYGGLCVDNDGTCSASVNGRIASVSTFTGNSDLAEMYFSSENLKAGEVVYLKGGLSVGRAGEGVEDKVIGVVSTKPGLLLGYDDISLNAGEKGYPLALSGRVPVRLSNENGEIKAGDELMLSSVPGVVMKATSTGKIVGVALENFIENRAYSDTYINQFGDDIAMPVFEPISKDNDPRIHDGCYFGGGRASGDEPCVPLVSTTTDDQRKEAEILAKAEAEKRALARLKNVPSEVVNLSGGREVRVGQIVMFVDLRYRYVDEDGMALIKALSANASSTNAEEVNETVWQRLINLANNFVDGVLSIFTLKADRVEVKNELCVDGVCIKADDLRQMLEKGNYQPPPGGINNNPPPSPEQNSDVGEEEEGEEVEEIDIEENLSDENTNELTEEEIDQTESDDIEEVINEESEEESEPQDPEPDIPESTETTPETSELINEDIIEETN